MEDGCLLRGTRVVIPAKHQETVLAVASESPRNFENEAPARLHVW